MLTERVDHLKNKKIFSELAQRKSVEFQNLKEKINHDNLIHKHENEGRSLKDFSNCQNLIDLFINLGDGNVNLKVQSCKLYNKKYVIASTHKHRNFRIHSCSSF